MRHCTRNQSRSSLRANSNSKDFFRSSFLSRNSPTRWSTSSSNLKWTGSARSSAFSLLSRSSRRSTSSEFGSNGRRWEEKTWKKKPRWKWSRSCVKSIYLSSLGRGGDRRLRGRVGNWRYVRSLKDKIKAVYLKAQIRSKRTRWVRDRCRAPKISRRSCKWRANQISNMCGKLKILKRRRRLKKFLQMTSGWSEKWWK